MKTSKAKTTGRPKKSSKVTKAEEPSTVSKTKRVNKVSNPVKSKKATSVKPLPSEEEIRIKAKEIYLRRIERGESGNAIDDWRKAEELLKGS
jgi:hypothetical protein